MLTKGKYAPIRYDNVQALAVDDFMGFNCIHKDLVADIQYIGNKLTWTGLLTTKKYRDKPNPQDCVPNLPQDPVPVPYPRPPIEEL